MANKTVLPNYISENNDTNIIFYSLGVLLYGPPGCGKTSLIRSVASSANLNVLTAMAAELYSPYLGVTEANISQLFQRARANVPAVLFIDEIGNKLTT